jgi:hypothetical protein
MPLSLLLCAALALTGAGAANAAPPDAGAPAPEPLIIDAPFASPSPPPPAAPAPTPPTAPDRWLLMKALQGTWEGALLDENRMAVSGWTDLTFTASSADDSNLPLGFNHRANQFLVQQNWIRFDQAVVKSGTTEPTFGFRNDWILPGADYVFTLPRGIFNDQLTDNHGRPIRHGIDPIQFYGEAYFPTVGRGLDIKLGRCFCQYGVESNAAVDNILESHVYTFIYDPFTHTGILATQQLTDAWSFQAGLMLGPDAFIDPVDEPTAVGSIKWAPPTGRDSVLVSFIANRGKFNLARNFNNPNILDVVYTHQFSSRLAYSYESLVGYQTNIPETGTADWFSSIHYLTYILTPRLSGTARLEVFDDAQGQRTGFKGLYTAFTAGINFRPRKDVIFRPELRYDYNDESAPFEGHHGLFTATTDVILRW